MAYGIMLNRPPPAVYRFTGEKGAVMVSDRGSTGDEWGPLMKAMFVDESLLALYYLLPTRWCRPWWEGFPSLMSPHTSSPRYSICVHPRAVLFIHLGGSNKPLCLLLYFPFVLLDWVFIWEL